MMTPKEIVLSWVACFNRADIDGLCAHYHNEAINHQVVCKPLIGINAIRQLFGTDFALAAMTCHIVKIHEAGIF